MKRLIAGLATVMVAGCSSSTGSTAAHAAPGGPAPSTPTGHRHRRRLRQGAAHGVEAAIGAIPGRRSAGWMLATGPGTGSASRQTPSRGRADVRDATTTLYLVDPAGGRYPITTFPPPGDKAGPGWSTGRATGIRPVRHDVLHPADSHLGRPAHRHTDHDSRHRLSPHTRPDGKAIRCRPTSTAMSLERNRIDLTGNQQLTYPTDQLGGAGQFSSDYLESPDGFTAGTRHGQPGKRGGVQVRQQSGGDGQRWIGHSKTALTDAEGPVLTGEWWSSTAIRHLRGLLGQPALANLWPAGHRPSHRSQLRPGAYSGFGPDLGDTDAWQLPSGTFLQSLGACGSRSRPA